MWENASVVAASLEGYDEGISVVVVCIVGCGEAQRGYECTPHFVSDMIPHSKHIQ